ncbi:MAG: Nramp family divalent metal transporter [Bacteroidales bacterium]|nr:Nramp family divalent metal transporter [Bacteroidales bacterium]
MTSDSPDTFSKPPKGLAILLLVGPSIVWCSEYIGSGEVILATRTGAILGTSVIWAVVFGIFLKFWIGMSGARYTVATGEGMIDMISRIPGPKNWGVWITLVAQTATAAIAIGSIASAAGIFLSSILPIPPKIAGWSITIFAVIVSWSGKFNWLKIIMSMFVLVVIAGVIFVSFHVFPGWVIFFKGLIPKAAEVPLWAIEKGIDTNPWKEVLPLLGWGAGGFASQVWYSYWVMGAGYGMAKKDTFGKSADLAALKKVNVTQAKDIKGWFRVVYSDATVAMIIGVFVTLGFLIAGAGILGPRQLAPDGEKVAIQLSEIFSSHWGKFGGMLFMIGGSAALISTQIGQLAGWPRLLADSFRICIPSFGKKLKWKVQFRLFLIFFFLSNMIIVYSLGYKPVVLVKLGAVLDGLLLTPLQAIWLIVGLYFVMPKFYSTETWRIIKPHWIFAAGLIIAFIVFGYFCIFQLPYIFN